MSDLEALLKDVRACTHCAEHFSHPPRPVLRARSTARLMIIGQAPGTRVQESGIPWNDPSGDRLRDWLDMEKDVFYDEEKIALVPMAFCYPGRDKNGADLPPRPECAPKWHFPILEKLDQVRQTLLVGSYAQKHYLGKRRKKTMTDTVQNWRDYAPRYFVLPHPSWRNTGWLKKNPWFETSLLPCLRESVGEVLKDK